MDSLAGFVAYDHSQAGDTRVRPPLLVTATVDAIRIRGTELSLEKDMKVSQGQRRAPDVAPASASSSCSAAVLARNRVLTTWRIP